MIFPCLGCFDTVFGAAPPFHPPQTMARPWPDLAAPGPRTRPCLPAFPSHCAPSHLRPVWRQYWAAGGSPRMKCFSLTKFVRSLDPMPRAGPAPSHAGKLFFPAYKMLEKWFLQCQSKADCSSCSSLPGHVDHGRQSSREPFSLTPWNFAGVIPKVYGLRGRMAPLLGTSSPLVRCRARSLCGPGCL